MKYQKSKKAKIENLEGKVTNRNPKNGLYYFEPYNKKLDGWWASPESILFLE